MPDPLRVQAPEGSGISSNRADSLPSAQALHAIRGECPTPIPRRPLRHQRANKAFANASMSSRIATSSSQRVGMPATP